MNEVAVNYIVSYLLQKRGELGRMVVVTHDHPDPDALASAWALALLCEKLAGVKPRIIHGGVIGRMENQMMVKTLRVPIHPARPQDLAKADSVALVDTQPPFQNNIFPGRRRATIVIDHHARNAKTNADFLLIDESAGATTTLLSEALIAAKVDVPPRLATAMVYGIGSETQNLIREAGPRDVTAYKHFLSQARVKLLSRIQNPQRPTSFFQTLGKAIQRSFVVGRVIGVHLGNVPTQDVIAHMADFLVTHEKMSWSIVSGRYGEKLYVSLRTRNPKAKAGRLLWRLLGSGTSAGGHAMIAGGAIPVGANASEADWEEAEQKLMAGFLASQGYKEPEAPKFPFRDTLPAEEEAEAPAAKPGREGGDA